MGKSKTPHKKFALRPISREPYTPSKAKAEGPTIALRGYFVGSDFTDLERRFLREIEVWQKRYRSKFLGHSAYLRILLELGFTPPPELAAPSTQPREDDP